MHYPCYIFLNKLIYLFLAALGLRCCVQAFSSCGEQGPLFAVLCGPLTAAASPVVEHGLQVRGLQQLQHTGSVVAVPGLQSTGSAVTVHGPSCFPACGILPDQGSNPRPLHQQADFQPLCHQGSPLLHFLRSFSSGQFFYWSWFSMGFASFDAISCNKSPLPKRTCSGLSHWLAQCRLLWVDSWLMLVSLDSHHHSY